MRYKGKTMKINGHPVADAKESVVLHIGKADVKNGRVKDPGKCAAALAAYRELGATEARVHLGRTYLRFNGKWERFHTSPALRSEIVAFDRGGKFEPGEYILYKMQPSRKGDVHRGSKGRVKKAYKKRGKYHVITGVRPIALSV